MFSKSTKRLIHWELCNELKFDHTNKWYMHKPETVLENETLKILWDFKIQTDHVIQAKRPNLVIVIKWTLPPQQTTK